MCKLKSHQLSSFSSFQRTNASFRLQLKNEPERYSKSDRYISLVISRRDRISYFIITRLRVIDNWWNRLVCACVKEGERISSSRKRKRVVSNGLNERVPCILRGIAQIRTDGKLKTINFFAFPAVYTRRVRSHLRYLRAISVFTRCFMNLRHLKPKIEFRT